MSTIPALPHSTPDADLDSAPFWQGLREHRILLQSCSGCGHLRCPPIPGCPRCGVRTSELVPSSGRGQIYSWITVHQPMGNLTEEALPCTIVTVQLQEGCRLVGRLHPTGEPGFNRPVTPHFIDRDDWTELAFRIDGTVPDDG